MSTLDEIRSRLATHEAERLEPEHRSEAGVALVIRDDRGPAELLFIERARREGDPWSGHMAFPGGRREPVDTDPRATAERETLEEVGVPLVDAEYLGHLADLQGRPSRPTGSMVISAHVYHVESPPELILDAREVEEAFWFPVESLHEQDRQVFYPFARYGDARLPGILVGDPERHIVWGLTYRFLNVLFDLLGQPLPDRSDRLRAP